MTPTYEVLYHYNVQFGVKALVNAETKEQAERAITEALKPVEWIQECVTAITDVDGEDELGEATFIATELITPQSNEHFLGSTEVDDNDSR